MTGTPIRMSNVVTTAPQINPITEEIAAMRGRIKHSEPVWLDDERLAKIVRLRVIGNHQGNAEFSYCYGTLTDGTEVRVLMDTEWFLRNPRAMLGTLIGACNDAGKKAWALGLIVKNNGTWAVNTDVISMV